MLSVNYNAARMYQRSSFTYFETGNPFDAQSHQRSASLFFRDMLQDVANQSKISLDSLPLTKTCVETLTDYVCLLAYPPCPLENLASSSMQSVSYLSPCRVHCTLIKNHCLIPLVVAEDLHLEALSYWYQCENFPTENCAMKLDYEKYLVLPPAFSAYVDGLRALYTVLLPVWFIVAAVVYHYGLSRERIKKMETLAAFMVPLMKFVSVIFSLSLWSTCVSSACHRWLGNALINTHVAYEAFKLFYFLLIAKGWQASRNVVNVEDMRGIMFASGMFFLASTILIALSAGGSAPVGVLGLYVVLYGYMLFAAYQTLDNAEKGAKHIMSATTNDDDAHGGDEDEAGLGAAMRRPLLFKRRLYYSFLLLVLVSIVAECFYHLLHYENTLLAYVTGRLRNSGPRHKLRCTFPVPAPLPQSLLLPRYR